MSSSSQEGLVNPFVEFKAEVTGRLILVEKILAMMVACSSEKTEKLVVSALEGTADEIDELNAEQPAFSSGEELTHQVTVHARDLLDHIKSFKRTLDSNN